MFNSDLVHEDVPRFPTGVGHANFKRHFPRAFREEEAGRRSDVVFDLHFNNGHIDPAATFIDVTLRWDTSATTHECWFPHTAADMFEEVLLLARDGSVIERRQDPGAIASLLVPMRYTEEYLQYGPGFDAYFQRRLHQKQAFAYKIGPGFDQRERAKCRVRVPVAWLLGMFETPKLIPTEFLNGGRLLLRWKTPNFGINTYLEKVSSVSTSAMIASGDSYVDTAPISITPPALPPAGYNLTVPSKPVVEDVSLYTRQFGTEKARSGPKNVGTKGTTFEFVNVVRSNQIELGREDSGIFVPPETTEIDVAGAYNAALAIVCKLNVEVNDNGSGKLINDRLKAVMNERSFLPALKLSNLDAELQATVQAMPSAYSSAICNIGGRSTIPDTPMTSSEDIAAEWMAAYGQHLGAYQRFVAGHAGNAVIFNVSRSRELLSGIVDAPFDCGIALSTTQPARLAISMNGDFFQNAFYQFADIFKGVNTDTTVTGLSTNPRLDVFVLHRQRVHLSPDGKFTHTGH